MEEREEHSISAGAQLRWAIYLLLFTVAVAGLVARITTVRSNGKRTPMLSANDRSRWSTVRALVEQGRYELDDVIFVGPQRKRSAEWHTIDLVRHRGHDGREHYYSSKPPLLATIVAGLYWPLHELGGWNMRHHAMPVIRLLLIVANVVPLAVGFWLLGRWAERYARTDWGRVCWIAAAAFGTFLTTFAITLNNHLPAAISTLIATYAALRIAHDGQLARRYFLAAGFFAALAAANELPALSFACLLTALLVWRYPARTLLYFVPAAVVVAVPFFVTNHLAHGSWRPAYSRRSDGPLVARVTVPPPAAEEGLPDALRTALASAGISLSDDAELTPRPAGNGAQIWDPATQRRYAASWQGDELELHEWGNWYEYEGSYWLPEMKRGVDRGERDQRVYALHVLVGHHGVFSLTPLWLLMLGGLWQRLRSGDPVLRVTTASIALITVACFAFYLSRPLIDRNYGGITSGFRWSFWLIPLWLWLLLPALDTLGRRRAGRCLAIVLLAVSVYSASYASSNPWSHPWLFDLGTWLGWFDYSSR